MIDLALLIGLDVAAGVKTWLDKKEEQNLQTAENQAAQTTMQDPKEDI